MFHPSDTFPQHKLIKHTRSESIWGRQNWSLRLKLISRKLDVRCLFVLNLVKSVERSLTGNHGGSGGLSKGLPAQPDAIYLHLTLSCSEKIFWATQTQICQYGFRENRWTSMHLTEEIIGSMLNRAFDTVSHHSALTPNTIWASGASGLHTKSMWRLDEARTSWRVLSV